MSPEDINISLWNLFPSFSSVNGGICSNPARDAATSHPSVTACQFSLSIKGDKSNDVVIFSMQLYLR